MDTNRKRLSVSLFSTVLTIWIASAQANDIGQESVKSFLREYLKGPDDKTTRYAVASLTLNDKNKQLLIYITGRNWCGTGGCMALLLQPSDDTYKVIDKFTLARLPIRVLASKTNGWNDIAMPVHGGGVAPGHTAILRFDGHMYPSNPSLAPKLAQEAAGSGAEIPLMDRDEPLY